MKLLAFLSLLLGLRVHAADSGVLLSEFIYETGPTPSCHATTIVETADGLAAAWFGGTREGASDVGIWLSRRGADQWSTPVEIATGVQSDGRRHPCWNPVLIQPKAGPLRLFYKVGPSPSTWWGMERTSTDGGKTWSDEAALPKEILGPIKNKAGGVAEWRSALWHEHRVGRGLARPFRAPHASGGLERDAADQ